MELQVDEFTRIQFAEERGRVAALAGTPRHTRHRLTPGARGPDEDHDSDGLAPAAADDDAPPPGNASSSTDAGSREWERHASKGVQEPHIRGGTDEVGTALQPIDGGLQLDGHLKRESSDGLLTRERSGGQLKLGSKREGGDGQLTRESSGGQLKLRSDDPELGGGAQTTTPSTAVSISELLTISQNLVRVTANMSQTAHEHGEKLTDHDTRLDAHDLELGEHEGRLRAVDAVVRDIQTDAQQVTERVGQLESRAPADGSHMLSAMVMQSLTLTTLHEGASNSEGLQYMQHLADQLRPLGAYSMWPIKIHMALGDRLRTVLGEIPHDFTMVDVSEVHRRIGRRYSLPQYFVSVFDCMIARGLVETFEIARPSLRRALKTAAGKGVRMTAPQIIHLIEQVASAGGLTQLHEVREAIQHVLTLTGQQESVVAPVTIGGVQVVDWLDVGCGGERDALTTATFDSASASYTWPTELSSFAARVLRMRTARAGPMDEAWATRIQHDAYNRQCSNWRRKGGCADGDQCPHADDHTPENGPNTVPCPFGAQCKFITDCKYDHGTKRR